MKKIVIYVLCIAMILTPCMSFADQEVNWTLYINGAKVDLLNKPEVVDDEVMLPLQEICQQLQSGNVTTEGNLIELMDYRYLNTVVVKFGERIVAATAGAELLYTPHPRRIDVAPYYKNGDLMVPAIYFLELGGWGSSVGRSFYDGTIEIEIPSLGRPVEIKPVIVPMTKEEIICYFQQKAIPELIFNLYSNKSVSADTIYNSLDSIYWEAWYNTIEKVVLESLPEYQRNRLEFSLSGMSAIERRIELMETANNMGISFVMPDYSTYIRNGSGQFYLCWDNAVWPLTSMAAVTVNNGSIRYYTLECTTGNSLIYEYTSHESKRLAKLVVKSSLTMDEFRDEISKLVASSPGNVVAAENKLNIAGVLARDVPEYDNPPKNAFDNDLNTRYAAIDFEAVFDLGSVQRLSKVDLAFWQNEIRQTEYSVSVSEDGENYILIFDGMSTLGNVYDTHYVDMDARYIRVCGNGNTINYWTSLLEIVPYGK